MPIQRIEDLIAQNKQTQTTTTSKHLPDDDSNPAIKLQEKMHDIELLKLEEVCQEQAAELGLEYINLKGFPVGPEVLSLIPEEQARRIETVVFFKIGGQIRIATCQPDNADMNDIIARIQHDFPGASVEIYLTSTHSMEEVLKLYKNIARVRHIETNVNLTKEDLERFQRELPTFKDLEDKLMQVNMTEKFAMIVSMSLNVGSSDIHIEAEEHNVVVRYRVDGLLQVAAKIPASIWPKLIARIKTISGLKINIDSVPQDGRITIAMDNDKMDIRVSTMPTAWGESVVMRLLKSSSVGLTFEQLGLRASAFKRLKHEMEKPQGMIITTGPTGSGKTTTLYAILNTLNKPDTKIITLENPIEYRMVGIAQSQIDHSKDYTFGKGLRAILRQDPNVIMVGEIRDMETGETAVQAALTGHLVLSTIHTNDAAGAIPRFLSMGVPGFLLAPAMNAMIGQRLVRKLCPSCKEEITLDLETMERVKKLITAIPDNSGEPIPDLATLKFYEGKGCDKCNHLGYKGRIGIYEIFTKNPEIEALTLSGNVSEYQMKEITHRAGMLNMAQDGILKAVEGVTSVAEVLRVTVFD
ncbi:MAG: type II/IV secretion system protein [Candidatus Kerfeldbacteria bacterium]|nr:type II/IV secretion system protein [Candidatus Kerfeldbacteria bacterium]